jgi:predicted double-glycine peptidase
MNNTFLRTLLAITILSFAIIIYPGISQADPPDQPDKQKIKQVPQRFKLLDLSKAPTVDEIMASGQFEGQLYPTSDEHTLEGNSSFGLALNKWNSRKHEVAVALFRKHIIDHPNSPWASEARFYLSSDLEHDGKHDEAEALLNRIIQDNQDKTHEGAKRLVTKAKLHKGMMELEHKNLDEATQILSEVADESLSWIERTQSHNMMMIIGEMRARGNKMANCGSVALAYLMEHDGNKEAAREVAEIVPESEKGHSISDIKELASGYGHELLGLSVSPEEIEQVSLPAIAQVKRRKDEDSGHYLVIENIDDEGVDLYDPQNGMRYSRSIGGFAGEWTGNVLFSAPKSNEELPGTVLSSSEMKDSYGGFCSSAKVKVSGAGSPGCNTGDCPPDPEIEYVTTGGPGGGGDDPGGDGPGPDIGGG